MRINVLLNAGYGFGSPCSFQRLEDEVPGHPTYVSPQLFPPSSFWTLVVDSSCDWIFWNRKKYVMLLGLACLTLHLALHYKMKKMETNLKQDMIKFRAEVKLEIEAAANAMQKEIASELAKSAQFRADSVVAFQKCKARPDVWSEYYCLTLLEALMRSRIDGK